MATLLYIQKGNVVVTKKPVPTLQDLIKSPDADETHLDTDDATLIDPSDNPVPVWQENHDHNLARVHPDVIASGPPSEGARIVTTDYSVDYAGEAEQDDKGLKGSRL